jgi:NAD(P)-dependent dehydrogenase (short-subunit alcohol dehydrogenase family)
MTRSIKDSVAVVTGASSGIGRASALALARQGAAVVVAARRANALDTLVDEIEAGGGRALAVPTDVTDQAQVNTLANRAIERFGRIDLWVNNAGVFMLGPFADTPAEDFRRVMETNFFGEVHGARAVLPIFREQRGGTLVNIASLDSRAPQPHASAYIASKHAVRALGMSLRQELLLDGFEDVHVVTILPATIDTPLFQHGANYTNRRIVAPPPVYPADEVVRAVFEALRDPKPEIYAGTAARAGNVAMKLMSGSTERVAAELVRVQEVEGSIVPSTSGNLFEPSEDEGRISGGWGATGSSRARKVALIGAALATIPLARRAVERLRHS